MASYSYTFDSQLMQHYSPDGLHSKSQVISAVYDENQHPMVFSVTNDSPAKLALTMADADTGQNVTIDLSKAFGLRRPVTHVVAFQDDAQFIYVAFAERASAFAESLNLHVCAGAKPASWRNAAKLPDLLLKSTRVGAFKLLDLFFVPSANAGTFFHDSNYPVLVAEYDDSWTNPPRAPLVQRIKVPFATNKWNFVSGELALPTVPAGYSISVMDKAVLSTGSFTICLATLYKIKGDDQVLLTVSSYNTSTDARRLAVIRNQTASKTNDLLLIGDSVYHYLSVFFHMSIVAPVRLTPIGDRFWVGVQDIITCQSGGDIAIWFQSSQQMLCTAGLAYNSNGIDAYVSQPPVPIHSGVVMDMSPVFRTNSQSPGHHILFLNDKNQHILLQYKPENAVWEEQQWVIRDSNLNTTSAHYSAVVAYNSHVVVKDDQGYAACSRELSLSASDTVTVSINGQRMLLGPVPKTVTTDGRGSLSLVSPVDSLGSSSIFQLWHNQQKIGATFDPATNIKAALSGVNEDNLVSQKLQTTPNEYLIEDEPLPAIRDAGAQLRQLHGKLSSLPKDGSIDGAQPMSIFGDAWNAWHYVERQVPIIHTFEEIANQIVMTFEIAEDKVKFVVNSIGRAMKAISYVLKNLKVDIARIVDWIGFIFEWDDIKKTQQDLVLTTKATFDQIAVWSKQIAPMMEHALDSADEMFNTMLDQMKGNSVQIDGEKSNFYNTLQTTSQKQTAKPENLCPPETHANLGSAATSPSSQWTANQMGSGNVLPAVETPPANAQFELARHEGDSLHRSREVFFIQGSGLSQKEVIYPKLLAPSKSSSLPMPDGIDELYSVIGPVLEDAEETIKQLVSNLANVVESGPENIGSNLVATIVDFGEDVVETFKDLLKAILECAEKLMGPLFDYIFASDLDIPFLSALWKDVTKGGDLPGILDIYCVLVAIPTTATGKIVAGKTGFWSDLTGWAQDFHNFDISKTEPTAVFQSIKSAIAQVNITEEHNKAHASDNTNLFPSARDDDSWANYTIATIFGHPSMAAVETVVHFIAAKSRYAFRDLPESEQLEAKMKNLDLAQVISELVATAFSFPNTEGWGTSQLADGAFCLEAIAFGTRVAEVFIAGIFILMRYKWPEKDLGKKPVISSMVLTVIEALLLSTASVLHAVDHKADEGTVEAKANFIAMANVLSSVTKEVCADSAEIEENWILDTIAGVAGVADTGLDLGRGIFELVAKEHEKHRVVTY